MRFVLFEGELLHRHRKGKGSFQNRLSARIACEHLDFAFLGCNRCEAAILREETKFQHLTRQPLLVVWIYARFDRSYSFSSIDLFVFDGDWTGGSERRLSNRLNTSFAGNEV